MQNKFKEFWIEEFVGNNFLRAYRNKPNFSPIKIQINKGPEVDGYIYYHLIEYAALESANAEIAELKQLVQEYSINAEGDDAHLEKIKEEMQFKIISLSTDLKASETSREIINAKLESANALINQLNERCRYLESENKKLADENARLREALESIAKRTEVDKFMSDVEYRHLITGIYWTVDKALNNPAKPGEGEKL